MNLRSVTKKEELNQIREDIPNIDKLLAVFPEESQELIIKNKEKLAKIMNSFDKFVPAATVNSILMTCKGELCPYASVCILLKNDIAPIGFPCPIERKIALELESDIVRTLEIDVTDPIEMEMLWDLIDTKLLDMRVSGALKDGSVVQTVESKIGQAITTRKETSPEIEIKIELKHLKHSIIDSFVATRRAKKKYGMSSNKNLLEEMIKGAALSVSTEDDVDGHK